MWQINVGRPVGVVTNIEVSDSSANLLTFTEPTGVGIVKHVENASIVDLQNLNNATISYQSFSIADNVDNVLADYQSQGFTYGSGNGSGPFVTLTGAATSPISHSEMVVLGGL